MGDVNKVVVVVWDVVDGVEAGERGQGRRSD